jgi:hypothetical protein
MNPPVIHDAPKDRHEAPTSQPGPRARTDAAAFRPRDIPRSTIGVARQNCIPGFSNLGAFVDTDRGPIPPLGRKSPLVTASP